MKKILGLLLISILIFSSCKMRDVEPGYVAVQVNKLGSNKGIQKETRPTGRYFVGWNQKFYPFPTFQVNYVYTASVDEGSPVNEEFTFQTKEGMSCGVDLGVAMSFEPTLITTMYAKYRKGVDEIRGIVVRNSIRDALNRVGGSMPIEYVYGAGKGILIDSVSYIVRKELDPDGIRVGKIFLIGTIRIPESVRTALDDKVKMTQEAQKAENEIAKIEAQAKIAAARAQGTADSIRIEADAKAYYNRTISASLTPQILQSRWIDAWEKGGSSVPTYLSGNGAANFMFQAK